MTRILFFILASACFISLGCSDNKRSTSSKKEHSSNVDNGAALLRSVSFQQWEKEIARFRGKVLVVDAWATWCEPCLERFPHMVSLEKKYAEQGVQFVSLNLDDKNSPADLVLAEQFISSMNANFPHYFLDENMMTAFEKLDFLSIPVVLIYDRKGDKRFHLSGDNPNAQYSDQDVEQAIQAVLNENTQAS